jgi:hypothetical protein
MSHSASKNNLTIIGAKDTWIPASAGMTSLNTVMPAQAGIQFISEEVAYDLEKE